MQTMRMTRTVNFPWFTGYEGETVTVDDEVAYAVVIHQNAAELIEGSPEPVRKIPNTEHPDPVGEVLPPKTEEAEKLKRPYGNATKDEWRKYAVATDPDLTEEAAADMSKVQLMQAYGERL
jgi:hypothetical protein